jgi:mRNA-degrading endonuclease RelE of RelBE toxin-antitoxin system
MRIKLQKKFRKQYFLLDRLTKKRVRKAIKKLRKGEIHFGKLSTGDNIHKIRVGDYRILIVKIDDVYIISDVELRKDVSRNL